MDTVEISLMFLVKNHVFFFVTINLVQLSGFVLWLKKFINHSLGCWTTTWNMKYVQPIVDICFGFFIVFYFIFLSCFVGVRMSIITFHFHPASFGVFSVYSFVGFQTCGFLVFLLLLSWVNIFQPSLIYPVSRWQNFNVRLTPGANHRSDLRLCVVVVVWREDYCFLFLFGQ